MKDHLICQSCAKPLTSDNRGTNRDSSMNRIYCNTCFAQGEFLDPSLSRHQLETQLMEMAEVHDQISLEEAEQIIRILPTLKRWQMSNI